MEDQDFYCNFDYPVTYEEVVERYDEIEDFLSELDHEVGDINVKNPFEETNKVLLRAMDKLTKLRERL